MAQIQSNAGVGTKNFNVLSADNPLKEPKDDQLGYAPFAEHLAESICKMVPPQGFVMAVYAPWGSGKSTLLNFLVHYLEQKPESEQPIIVRFNPWWFSGQEDLTRRFFDQLQAVLSKKWKSVAKDLTKRIANFADTISEAPVPYAKSGKVFAKFLGQQKDVYKLKEEVEKILESQQKRIFVVIDDIDRLTAEEIRQLFRVIKAVANFPNIVYLLLFDKEVVVKALAETQRIPGEAYLEKIVQVPFELPLPDKISLHRLLDEQLNSILADTPEQLFDKTYWSKLYAGIDYFINTPRDIKRLTNTLRVTYPAVKGEVNAADFIAIEVLRVFYPSVYNIIRKNSGAFTEGNYEDSLNSLSKDSFKTFHNSWISQFQEKDRELMKRLITHLFPRLEGAFDKNSVYYPRELIAQQRKQRRMCSAENFPIYFRLAIPEGGISHAEMQAMLALASNSRGFAAKLLELANQTRPDGTTRIREFLERFRDYADEDISLDSIPSILQALFEVGDQLWRLEDERGAFFNIGNETQIEILIGQLLERLQAPVRFEELSKAISNGKAIATIVWEVIFLGQQHGKYEALRATPEDERLINIQQLQELEELALEKVREVAQQDYLLQVPKLRPILAFWRSSAREDEVKQWFQEIITEDKKLAALIENLHKWDTNLELQWFMSSLEPYKIINRVRSLADDNWLTENQKTAIRQFIQGYEIRQQGIDPNSRFSSDVR